jgi:hypothetical protein
VSTFSIVLSVVNMGLGELKDVLFGLHARDLRTRL